jgi:hypothetical protein
LAGVPVAAVVLRATADLLDLLGEFFTRRPGHPQQAGPVHRQPRPDHDYDPTIEANLTLHEVAETADLLHTLTDSTGGPA